MRSRFVGVVVAVAAAAVLAVLAWPQALGLERTEGIAQIVALRGAEVVVACALGVLLVALGLIVRRARVLLGALAVILFTFALAVTSVLLVRGIGAPDVPSAGANDVTVLSWNTLGDSVPAPEIARVALAYHADVVALPETTAGTAAEVATLLKRAGRDLVPHTLALDHEARARSTSLLIDRGLGRYRLTRSAGDTGVLPSLVAEPSGGQRAPVIVAVHAVAPSADEVPRWRSDLRWIAGRCSGGNVLLAGDFNATLDHLDGLGSGAAGIVGACRDAALATGNGAVGTWPTSVPPLVGAPIDHVLATPNWTATGFRVLAGEDAAGSDHRPVLARFAPSGSGG
jgi:endonuclease/exonuclease/phosphatase (EEP) superfamily protein YafD